MLLSVHPPVPYKAAVAAVGHDAVQRYYDEESDAALSGARDLLTARGVPFEAGKRIGTRWTRSSNAPRKSGFK